jgi:hypothetical protein
MPKIATFLSLDFGSLIGPFFFTLAFNLLFPTIVVSLVYEKEVSFIICLMLDLELNLTFSTADEASHDDENDGIGNICVLGY